MTRRRSIVLAALVVTIAAIVWLVVDRVPRLSSGGGAPGAAAPAAAPGAGRKINATLYFVAQDGLSLVGVAREVPFGDPVAEQARRIVEAQLQPAPQPFASPAPPGTSLRSLYVSERGDAFVDLSADASAKHTGGVLDEIFTVYAIVDALTVNLPAVKRVQILIDGKEVETLAGHVDLRHPLPRSLKWIKPEKNAS